jgi:chromosome partitioning protein
MTIVVTIANQKGGVGKTTTAVTLAHGLALKGKETLLIDVDPQGQSATALGVQQEPGVFNLLVSTKPPEQALKEVVRFARENLHIVPGDAQTAHAQLLIAARQEPADYILRLLKPVTRNGLKYIVFDTSPSVGGIQERALFAADLVVIPCATDFLSADAVSQTINTMQRNVAMGWKGGAWILPTFYDDTTRESQTTLSDLREIYGDQVIPPIHRATILRECAAEGKTIWEKDGESRAAKEYSRLLYRVLEL